MKLVLTDKDGYEAVSDIIKEWAEKNQPYVYCAYIVDIWRTDIYGISNEY